MNAISEKTLALRRETVSRKLAAMGFDALVVHARGSAAAFGSKSHGYMRYLTDWDTYHSPGVLVLAPGRNPTLLTSDVFLQKLTAATMPAYDARFRPLPELGCAAAETLRDSLGALPRRVAYIGRSETPVDFWESFAAGLGQDAAIIPFERELDMDLAVKDAEQYALHREAAKICDAMFRELDRLVPLGLSAWRMRSALATVARDAGAEHSLIWLSVAPVVESAHFYREDSTRAPAPGDQVLCGLYVMLRGHWGHGIRMGCYGEPTTAMLRGYDAVRELQDTALALLRPGNDLYGVNTAMEKVFAARYPGPRRDIFRFRYAHGLGHFSEDPLTTDPFRHGYAPGAPESEGASLEIRPGMLFELHPNVFQAGVAGAALGDMACVTPDGPELTLAFPREFTRWGA